MLQPFPLNEISSRDFELLIISYEILGKLLLGNPLSPRWHLCHLDDSTQLCKFSKLYFWLLAPYTLGPQLS